MKVIYEFFWDCGRMGDLEGIFIAEEKDVKEAIGEEVYFGEVLGKHSEIYGVLNEKDLKIKSKDQDFIKKFEEIIPNGIGFNPIAALREADE